MTDMVWLVTQGEFGDYEIVHVFSDEDTATKHVEQWNAVWPGTGSMERHVDARKVELELPELAVLHHAEWWSHEDVNNGDVYSAGVVTETDRHTNYLGRLNVMHFDDGNVKFTCSSFNSERALKIVADARAKYLAQEAGL